MGAALPDDDALDAPAAAIARLLGAPIDRQPHRWERLKSGSSAIGTVRRAQTAVLCVPARTVPAAMRSAIPPLRTVLVPTDFSEIANAAIPYGYSLLRGTGGTVELCHVHEGHLSTPVHVYGNQDRLSPEQTRELETRLRALVPPESEGLGITTRLTVIDGGAAAEAILQAAQRLGADAITLGSHGRSGLARTVMGSVAETVLRGSDKPVFVVRPRGR